MDITMIRISQIVYIVLLMVTSVRSINISKGADYDRNNITIQGSEKQYVLIPISKEEMLKKKGIPSESLNSGNNQHDWIINGNETSSFLKHIERKVTKISFPRKLDTSQMKGDIHNDEELRVDLDGESNPKLFSFSLFSLLMIISMKRCIKLRMRNFVTKSNYRREDKKWEDELLRDIAFITIPSDSGYGSFDLSWTDDHLDKFDII